MSDAVIEKAEAVAAELKSEESFDLSAALKGTSYPTDDVTIFLNGEKAHELNGVLQEISELGFEGVKYTAGQNGGMADSPEKEAIDEQIAELEAQQKELIKEITGSALTFTLRGAAPEQWKLIIKRWKRKAKSLGEDIAVDEEERQQWASDKIDAELLAKCVVKATNAKGQVNRGALTVEKAEELRATVLESEFAKLIEAVNNLTFANGLFNQAIASDADFLSKP